MRSGGHQGSSWARGKRRSPTAAARHSQPVLAHTDFPRKFFSPENFRVEPALSVLKKQFPPKNFAEPACSDFPIFFKHIFPKLFELILLWFSPLHTFFPFFSFFFFSPFALAQSELEAAAASGRVGEVPKKVN